MAAVRKENINTDQLLVTGYIHKTAKTLHIAIPKEIINLIFIFFHVIFDFDVIDKKYGTNDTLKIDSIPDDAMVSCDGRQVVGIVICFNSENILIGFPGANEPCIAIPNIISYNNDDNEILIGHQVKKNNMNINCNISSPIKNGKIIDWNGIKIILLKALNKFITSTQHEIGILMTECIGLTQNEREKYMKLAFDDLGCYCFYLIPRALLSLYGSGRTTGIVLFSDYHSTEITPIYEGYIMKKDCMMIDFGKKHVINYCKKNNKNDDDFDNNAMKLFFNFNLCDGINMNDDEGEGIDKLIEKCIHNAAIVTMKHDSKLNADFYSNIHLSGINTKFKGLLTNELKKKLDKNNFDKLLRVKVVGLPERAILDFVGGSILSALTTFEYMWVTKSEYDQNGASIVQRKCVYWA